MTPFLIVIFDPDGLLRSLGGRNANSPTGRLGVTY